ASTCWMTRSRLRGTSPCELKLRTRRNVMLTSNTRSALFISLMSAVVIGLLWQTTTRPSVMARESSAQGVRGNAGVSSPGSNADRLITRHAQRMIEDGRQIFRYDTFGSEAFWGDALQLHKAIAGAKNGGIGGGVSPKTALSVGLKVDAEVLPDALKQQIKD